MGRSERELGEQRAAEFLHRRPELEVVEIRQELERLDSFCPEDRREDLLRDSPWLPPHIREARAWRKSFQKDKPWRFIRTALDLTGKANLDIPKRLSQQPTVDAQSAQNTLFDEALSLLSRTSPWTREQWERLQELVTRGECGVDLAPGTQGSPSDSKLLGSEVERPESEHVLSEAQTELVDKDAKSEVLRPETEHPHFESEGLPEIQGAQLQLQETATEVRTGASLVDAEGPQSPKFAEIPVITERSLVASDGPQSLKIAEIPVVTETSLVAADGPQSSKFAEIPVDDDDGDCSMDLESSDADIDDDGDCSMSLEGDTDVDDDGDCSMDLDSDVEIDHDGSCSMSLESDAGDG